MPLDPLHSREGRSELAPLDTGKAGWWVGCYSRELVSVGMCRQCRDSSTDSVRQRRADTLKAGKLEVIGLVQLPVCRQTGIEEDASALTHSGSHKLATESTHCRRMPPPESSR